VWQAIGPSLIPAEKRERFFTAIGMAPLPDAGNYFRIIPDEVSEGRGLSVETFTYMLETSDFSPWDETRFPPLAAWLSANEEPMRLLTSASRRERYFSPRWANSEINGRSPVMTSSLAEIQPLRQVVRAFASRAMLRAEKGQVEEARQDLLTCHRIGRLLSQDGFLLELLVGIAMDGVACRAEQALANQGKLSLEQTTRFARDLDGLPPLAEVAAPIDGFERWLMLDLIHLAAENGIATAIALANGQEEPADSPWRKLSPSVVGPSVDWDAVLRFANEWYDRVVAAARITRTSRPIFSLERSSCSYFREFRRLWSRGIGRKFEWPNPDCHSRWRRFIRSTADIRTSCRSSFPKSASFQRMNTVDGTSSTGVSIMATFCTALARTSTMTMERPSTRSRKATTFPYLRAESTRKMASAMLRRHFPPEQRFPSQWPRSSSLQLLRISLVPGVVEHDR
jgi:hypothetical protein